MHRGEIAVLREPPGRLPTARVLWSDGGWVTMVLTAVDGRHPLIPWRPAEIATLTGLAAALTPDPVGAQPIADVLAHDFGHW